MTDKATVTHLLEEARNGESTAATELWNVVYQEVRQMAKGKLTRERETANLQTTMLVHEAYMKMWPKDKKLPDWKNRRHFFGSLSRVMEQYLIDYSRARSRVKRGSGRNKVSLTIAEGELQTIDTIDSQSLDVMLIALNDLSIVMPRAAEVVRHRYIAGLTISQTAKALDVSDRTVVDDWDYARAYLLREISHRNI